MNASRFPPDRDVFEALTERQFGEIEKEFDRLHGKIEETRSAHKALELEVRESDRTITKALSALENNVAKISGGIAVVGILAQFLLDWIKDLN